MPLPFIFIGIAAVTGTAGVGQTVKSFFDQAKAKNITNDTNAKVELAGQKLNYYRKECGEALRILGEEKVYILNNSIKEFIDSFTKLKNVNFTESKGITEINRLCIDHKEFEELEEMSKLSLSLAEGGIAGVAGGTLAAFGAYSAAGTFASASTGTAIASLSGAAASNATLAFFGGGSLASGGLGIAGGAVILGGLVAGPALLVMGIITEATARKDLQKAYTNAAKGDEAAAELTAAARQCIAIRRISYMLYALLTKLDTYLYPLLQEMKRVINDEGCDYSEYSSDSKKTIAAAVSTVSSVKAVLDTAILSESGELTEESKEIIKRLT